ncbi:MAG TPA: hypothetical protein DCG19_09370 [Cryomorphaceae bacterium]|nr:hypothetical protein [Owenweeksia sp.]MBF99120.1 hypothetical protein [Owenweeksia sp.]HAD97604.1 hypothetical protein [Cryomorphaceae bacterium]HBF21145.1 hypothetical protein [Cryomorphaceae bacterium]|tara:strand:+ start:86 stop:400 length:315 start_codon:yes stop_codon:yes gene_type:complete
MILYKARVLFRILKENNQADFDEQLMLIEASSAEEARQRLEDYGAEESETFTNIRGQLIHWIFEKITDLRPLRFQNGLIQMDSRTIESEESEEALLRAHRINLN